MSAPSLSVVRLLLGIAAVILYSLAMHYTSAVRPNPDLATALVLAPFLGAALLGAGRSPLRLAACAAAIGALLLLWPKFTTHLGWLYYVQHAGIYALLALMFGRTLASGRTPLIVQFATLIKPDISPTHARYARQATVAWTVYFVATAVISSLLFFFASFESWSIFANVLGTPLLISMFVLEFAVRCRVLPPEERSTLKSGWEAWQRYNARQRADGEPQQPPAG